MRQKKSFRSVAPVWAAFAVPIVWLAVLLAGRYEEGMTVFDLAAQFSEVMKTPFALRWTPHTVRFIGIFLLLYGGAILFYYTGQKNTRPGEEHGSASWGSVRELDRKYRDKDATQNVILTQHLQIQIENLCEKIYRGQATRADITRLTRRLGDYIAAVYGFEITKQRTRHQTVR